MTVEHDLYAIAEHFRVAGRPTDITPITAGHINDTFILTVRADGRTTRYILQRINHLVFKNPPETMTNVVRVTEHIRAKTLAVDPSLAARQLAVMTTDDDQGYHRDTKGNYWRVYNFIECAVTHETLESTELAREAARMFGWFQRMLTDLPGPPLYETIVGFHDTPRRLEVFRKTLKADVAGRVSSAKRETEFVLDNAAICDILPELMATGEIPIRIAHNDAKINNVMLDKDTGKGVCVIDLDTVMPGLSIHDFGDLVRTATCPAAEDERDLSKVAVDLDMFGALVQGFAQETHGFLTPAERRHLTFGGKLITFEQLIRFLTDYLAGDVYYKVYRPGHNLDRSRTQMKLVESIIGQEAAMNARVENAFWECAT